LFSYYYGRQFDSVAIWRSFKCMRLAAEQMNLLTLAVVPEKGKAINERNFLPLIIRTS
jgi:hypothetical protein